MRKQAIVATAAMVSLGAFAFESWMMRVPDSLGAVEGSAEFKIPYNDPKAIAIPLKDGSHVVVLNQTPYKPGEGKYGLSGIGEPKKVADGNVVSRMVEAAAKIPTVKVNMGGVTWFAVYEEVSKMYAGKVVSRGGCFMVYVGLPEGRVFDDEIRAVLAQVEFVPPADFGIETALKMYGKASRLKAAMKYPALKKMVAERAECVELIEALMGAAKETGHDDTAEWCLAALKKLHPSVYAPDGVNSVKRYDDNDDAQKKASSDLFGADRDFEKATAKIPPFEGGTDSVPAAAKTKTVTLPGGVPMEFIWCEKGTFTMGQNDGEFKPLKKQEPRRKVTLSKGFWLAKYETTQRQWKSIASGTPSKFTGDDDLPVDNVSWKQCKAFAAELEKRSGIKLRLPTEAEWEYACRAGTRTAYYWGYQPSCKKANYDGVSANFNPKPDDVKLEKTVKVGSYEPNPWGFYDMAGNVAEWCEDDWIEEPPAANEKDPLNRKDGSVFKVLRGGSWENPAVFARSASREWNTTGKHRSSNGVRFVLEDE